MSEQNLRKLQLYIRYYEEEISLFTVCFGIVMLGLKGYTFRKIQSMAIFYW